MIEEVGAWLRGAMKRPSKIKAMFKCMKDKRGAGENSSQLKDNTCQRTNRDNLSLYEFMLKIKSSIQTLKAMRQEKIGAGNLTGCDINPVAGLQKGLFDVLI